MEFAWLSTAAPNIYSPTLDPILAQNPNGLAGLLFFVIYPIGICYFAVLPSKNQWRNALIKGALLGFVCYATYDLTNFATLKIWSGKIMLFDLGWGTAVTALSSAAATILLRKIIPEKDNIEG